jgi:hypothetical protein
MELYRSVLIALLALSLRRGGTTAFQARQSPRLKLWFLGSQSGQSSDVYDIAAALVKLPWEVLEDLNRRPILNLSSRDQASANDETEYDSTSCWDQGQRWSETKRGLQERGISADDALLERFPQLLRLDPFMVLKTADWVIQEFGTGYLESEPRLLTFREEHAQYGLEFLSTMMMMNAKPICQRSSALMLSGIDGGIQERAVSSALGAAGAATSQASQAIAGDAMVALRSLQNLKK